MSEKQPSGENPRTSSALPPEHLLLQAPKSPKLLPPPGHSKKRRRLFAIIGMALAIVIGFFLFLFFTRKPKPAPPPPPVRVSTTNATQGNIGIYVNALGLVTPLATITVSSQVTGQLTNVNFEEGQMVKAGDLLTQIDDRPFQAQLTAAEGTLERDQALLAEARLDLERYQKAAAQNAIPKQQLDDQLALVQQDAGTVKFDQGQVETAKVQLAYCRITSPISGRVGLRLVDAGNLVQTGSTNGLAVLTQLQPITIIFSVAEDYLPQIQHQWAIGNHMTAFAYDRAQQTNISSGSVLALDNLIDTATGTIRLKSIFTNADNALFPNQFVNVRLLVDTLTNKTLIPSSAVQRNAQSAFVFVVKSDETVEMRTVQTDVTDGETTSVEGVKPGEVVVTDNFNRLQDKARVAPRKPGDNAADKGNSQDGGSQKKSGKDKKTEQKQ